MRLLTDKLYKMKKLELAMQNLTEMIALQKRAGHVTSGMEEVLSQLKEHKQALSIGGVSQQRELLKAFAEWLDEGYKMSDTSELLVRDFLDSRNSG